MKRFAVLLYGVVAYAMFLGVFSYIVLFLANFLGPKTIDSGEGLAMPAALAVNLGLMGLFGLQHSVMARPSFKRWWTKFVPSPIERSTYVVFTNICLIALFVLWQPINTVVWNVANPVGQVALWSLFGLGWAVIFLSTCLLNHFDLFGLRQVWMYFRGKPYTHLPFKVPGFYRFVRHPLYVGWMVAFWATPTMTVGHMLFAACMTGYMLIAIQFEERNLVEHHGEAYVEYRKRTPMLLPVRASRRDTTASNAAQATA